MRLQSGKIKNTEKEKMIPLSCPMGDLVLPLEGNTMKTFELLKRHFLEYHDRIQLGDALATKILEKTDLEQKIKDRIKELENPNRWEGKKADLIQNQLDAIMADELRKLLE